MKTRYGYDINEETFLGEQAKKNLKEAIRVYRGQYETLDKLHFPFTETMLLPDGLDLLPKKFDEAVERAEANLPRIEADIASVRDLYVRNRRRLSVLEQAAEVIDNLAHDIHTARKALDKAEKTVSKKTIRLQKAYGSHIFRNPAWIDHTLSTDERVRKYASSMTKGSLVDHCIPDFNPSIK